MCFMGFEMVRMFPFIVRMLFSFGYMHLSIRIMAYLKKKKVESYCSTTLYSSFVLKFQHSQLL